MISSAQNKRKPARCQRTTVSGRCIPRTPDKHAVRGRVGALRPPLGAASLTRNQEPVCQMIKPDDRPNTVVQANLSLPVCLKCRELRVTYANLCPLSGVGHTSDLPRIRGDVCYWPLVHAMQRSSRLSKFKSAYLRLAFLRWGPLVVRPKRFKTSAKRFLLNFTRTRLFIISTGIRTRLE